MAAPKLPVKGVFLWPKKTIPQKCKFAAVTLFPSLLTFSEILQIKLIRWYQFYLAIRWPHQFKSSLMICPPKVGQIKKVPRGKSSWGSLTPLVIVSEIEFCKSRCLDEACVKFYISLLSLWFSYSKKIPAQAAPVWNGGF